MKKANGTNSVYKTANGMWVGQIVIGKYDNGNLKYKRFTSKKQSTVVEKMSEYQHSFTNTNDASNSYLSDYLLGYLNNVKKNSMKATSFSRDMETYGMIKRYIGKFELRELTPYLIQCELINHLKDDGVSYSSIHKCYVLLNECLKYALLNKKISENPCITVKKPSKSTFKKKPIRFFDEDEIKRFEKCAMSTKPNGKLYYTYGLLCCLDIYTGLRCGELAALKWEDIDIEHKYITVNKVISSLYEFDENGNRTKRITSCEDTTKTNDKGRIVNLNTKSLRIIEQIKEYYGNNCVLDNYISTNSTEYRAVNTISQCYVSIADTAKIENPLGIHTLRHTFASLLIKKGVDIKIVSELLGHKDVAFTYNTYVHLIDEQKAKAIELLDLD